MSGASPSRPPEITESRVATVGDQKVRRALPLRTRRTVGAWCFADHFGPTAVSDANPMDVGPHPHIGLQTVTWLVSGELLHRDNLGSEQLIRPGQLNLMTAGHGVSHAEEHPPGVAGDLHGIQLWVALPEATRHGEAAFEHHGELPRTELPNGQVTVLVGALAGVSSTARHDTDLVGSELLLRAGRVSLALRPDFEYAAVVLEGALGFDGEVPSLVPGHLAYLGSGRDELEFGVGETTRVILLGGTPFESPILMSWNFVARDRSEVDQATRDWNTGSDRFGEPASGLPRIPAPPPIWS